jgi:hypothetical protein
MLMNGFLLIIKYYSLPFRTLARAAAASITFNIRLLLLSKKNNKIIIEIPSQKFAHDVIEQPSGCQNFIHSAPTVNIKLSRVYAPHILYDTLQSGCGRKTLFFCEWQCQ